MPRHGALHFHKAGAGRIPVACCKVPQCFLLLPRRCRNILRQRRTDSSGAPAGRQHPQLHRLFTGKRIFFFQIRPVQAVLFQLFRAGAQHRLAAVAVPVRSFAGFRLHRSHTVLKIVDRFGHTPQHLCQTDQRHRAFLHTVAVALPVAEKIVGVLRLYRVLLQYLLILFQRQHHQCAPLWTCPHDVVQLRQCRAEIHSLPIPVADRNLARLLKRKQQTLVFLQKCIGCIRRDDDRFQECSPPPLVICPHITPRRDSLRAPCGSS